VKALIKVGYACNEHCTFCHTQPLREIQGTGDEVEAKIHRAKQLGHTMVVLSGGEPTIRPELFRWAALVAELDMDFGLVTNGLVLAYPDVRARLFASRLRYVYMSLHAARAPIHDRIVRAQSFDAAVTALRGLSGHGLALTVNCVVTRQNQRELRPLVDLVASLPDATLKFSATEPKGGGLTLMDLVVPRIGEAAAHVLDALRHAEARMPGRARHGGFPLCLLPGFEAAYDDLRTHDYWTMVEIGEPDLVPVDDENKLHPSPHCDDCSLRGGCPGLFHEYHRRFGSAELGPARPGPRSNSFTWTLERVEPIDPAAPECPVRVRGVAPFDRGRHLFVRHEGKLARYRTDTRDFDDRTIAEIKHVAGQVYLDASRKPAPDDFARDLVKLERSRECGDCPELERCTGLFEPRFESVFERDEDDLRRALAAATGDVLEIGCGGGRITEVWREAIAAGTVRWLGIDPDADALAALRDRLPTCDVRCGDAEAIAPGLATASFDHVVVAHAWNHLRDPAALVPELVRVLRPGGSLWVFDDVAFGLVRTPGQQRAARRSTAGWQHLRNDVAARAHATIDRIGGGTGARTLELVERRDVAPSTSNQWRLRYVRVADTLTT
jgi:MoaA/NifB/PqqE/SkfB family radical SAM enzyme